MMKRHELTDEQWELLSPLIPRKAAPGGATREGSSGDAERDLLDSGHRCTMARSARSFRSLANRASVFLGMVTDRCVRHDR
jgi:hypothetical protein